MFWKSLLVTAFAAATYGQTEVPQVPFEKQTLPNGLQLILHVDRKLPMVNVNLWYHVGSKNERVGRSGFAHLFEHLMFEGSKNAPGKTLQIFEKLGANLFEGGVNGTTDWDRTNYFETVPSGSLERVLWLESDRMATLAEALTQQKLDNQRDVVKNERRQGLENEPYGRWIKLVCENLFPSRHPYANDVIGSHEDLTAASADDVREFFRTYYTPNNLSLTIAGDIDPAEAKRLVERYFGGIPAGPALDRPPRWMPSLEGEKIVEANDRVPQERTYFAWISPGYFQAGDADLDLTSTILTDGLSARLNKVLVYDKQLCSDTVSFQFTHEMVSAFLVWATARPGVPLSQIEPVVTAELARLAKEGPTEAELKRAKAKWEYGFVTGLERIGGFGGKADLLNNYNTYLGNPDRFAADVERHRNVTQESVRQTVAKWLDTRNRLLVRFHPETSGRGTVLTELDRSKQPPLGSDRPFEPPQVQTSKLDNGLQLFVVERRDLPKVAVMLATRAGSVYDPAGKDGLANLGVQVMKRGTQHRQALQIEDALGDLGTSIDGFAAREHAAIRFESLKRNLAPALEIFADVVRNPSFPGEEVDREKKKYLDALAQDEQEPNAIAARVSAMLAFGPDHPYGRPARGLPSTVRLLAREDFARFHETYWKPGGSILIFAGDISLPEASELARKNFGTWSGAAPKPPDIPDRHPMGPGKVYLVDHQNAAQTIISDILPAPPRRSDDYYALQLANNIWGGSASGRLNSNLREEKGYSYGVFSFPAQYSKAGMWKASGGVQTNKTKESVVEFVKELKLIAGEKPVTDQELAGAKANRVRGYAQEFESLSRIADHIAQLWSLELPMAEIQREPAELEKTTRTSVNAVAEKYAQPAGATLLLVGDLSKIESDMRALKMGDVVVLDPEGKPLRK